VATTLPSRSTSNYVTVLRCGGYLHATNTGEASVPRRGPICREVPRKIMMVWQDRSSDKAITLTSARAYPYPAGVVDRTFPRTASVASVVRAGRTNSSVSKNILGSVWREEA